MKTPFALTVRFHDCADEEMPHVQERDRFVFLGNFGIKSNPQRLRVESAAELRFLTVLRLAYRELQEFLTGLQAVHARPVFSQFGPSIIVRQFSRSTGGNDPLITVLE